MKDEARNEACPLEALVRTSPPAGREGNDGAPLAVRFKRALKRRLGLRVERRLKAIVGKALDASRRRSVPAAAAPAAPPAMSRPLRAGERVRVRSKAEIEATLDRWRSLKGCAFLEEMAVYCGTTQAVLKRVERFIDERDFRSKKASGIILLEGLTCSGTRTTGRCDRSCYFFWREEWLEELNEPAPPGA